MDDLEERLRRYADASVAATAPVTADEARARGNRRPRRSRLWMVAAAAAVIGLVAAGVAFNRGGTVKHVTANGDYPLTLDGQTQWQLAVINSAINPSDAEIRSRYSARFVAAVPVSKFRSSVDTVARRGPWRVLKEIERRDDRVLAVQLASANGEQARLTLHRTSGGQFDASTILFAGPCAPAVDAATPLSPELGDQLAWIKTVLASSVRLTDAELEEHFSPSFLDHVPPEKLRADIEKLRALGPYSFRNYEGPPTSDQLAARVGVFSGEEARLSLTVDTEAPKRISAFGIFTQPPCTLPAG